MKNIIGKTGTITVDVEIVAHEGNDVRVRETDSGEVYWIEKSNVQIDE